MKQLNPDDFFAHIYGVKIYRDDLEYLINFCENNFITINKIIVKDCLFESFDELISHKGYNISELKLEGKQKNNDSYNSISIDIKKDYIHLFLRGSTEFIAFGYKIKDYFKRKIPWHFYVFNPYIWFFSSIIFFLIAAVLKKELLNLKIILLLISVFFIVIWLISIANRYYNFYISLKRKHEIGFFRRNKDKILVSLISSLIGALLGAIMTYILTH